MAEVYLHLGSNVGDRYPMLLNAMDRIEMKIGKISARSSIYETEAWGNVEQDNFLNMVVKVETKLNPPVLMKQVMEVENLLGKEKKAKWGPRNIDIDILLYGDVIVKEDDLTLPHARLHERNFVLIPMLEIAQDEMHPVLQKTIDELYDECRDDKEVWIWEPESSVEIK